MRFDWPRPATVIADLVQRHVAHREQAGFRGMESAQLNRLLVDYAKADSLLVGLAYDDATGRAAGPCSALALLCHGSTATYQLAWNDSCGRALGANNGLLWAGMEKLRACGVRHLDLGEHSGHHTPGLQRYKAGLCGYALQLIGMYE
ncbi:GNAT family N-acetyltransferase [Propionivibrio sp.]|uniref:GNAT family N-acetyltransferase n=1 Tax=Propionivibrio sp. TaxID=2212460 RepID=UPI003BEF58CA